LVNLSLGFSTDSLPLQQAIQRLYNSGVIMVASAGNRCGADTRQDDGGGAFCGPAPTCTSPLTTVKYPAAYPWVIAVAAIDIANAGTDYSISGAAVDVAAPGGAQASGQILSTNKGGGYGVGYGTSQAAAHVTGAVALALQKQWKQSFEQVRSLLQTTATVLPGFTQQQQGAGLIDAEKKLEALP